MATQSEAEHLVMQGDLNAAIPRLRAIVAANPADGAAHLLLCRAFYSEDLPDEAVGECEAALSTFGSDSRAQDWAGRAFGIKADRSGPIAGYKLAGRTRDAFEAAVRLDPDNADAVNDAAEYYVSAPSLVGGGVEKALALASRVQARLPQAAFRIRALVAEKQHDYPTAERHFKSAVAVAGRADAWVDLGNFYFRRGRTSDGLNALQHALAADRSHGPERVDVASILIDNNTAPDLAQKALREYLASPARSDAAPSFKAYVLLGKVLATSGDKSGAQAQYEKALALAKDYAPAEKAMQHP
jgi:tetratricopeptide (TPR) repeat protein